MFKATFVLLSDVPTQNRASSLAYEAREAYGSGLRWPRLPAHISLKQPFVCADLRPMEEYFVELAQRIEPFQVDIRKLQYIPPKSHSSGVIWLDVKETPHLRGLHERMNEELAVRFGPCPALFDGDAYHFHMTVALCCGPAPEPEKLNPFLKKPVAFSYMVRDLAMFVYIEEAGQCEYMVYRIERLRRAQTEKGYLPRTGDTLENTV